MDIEEELNFKCAETVLKFYVNGKKVIENNPDPKWTLLWYLRNKLQLTGTKSGCGEGGCGACTVMLSQYLRDEDRIKHFAANACLTNICAVHGLAVTTVEGIGSVRDRLHPVQERIAKAHGSQCGFCTPGIVMSMYALLRSKQKIDYKDIETALQGNLCRCTGYRPIIEGFMTFTEGWERFYTDEKGLCQMGDKCCKNNKTTDSYNADLFNANTFQPYHPSQEPIFPPELKINHEDYSAVLLFKGDNVTWLRPKTIEDVKKLKKYYPNSKIVVGNTEIGIEVKFKNKQYPMLIYPTIVSDMNCIKLSDNHLVIGAAKTLTEILEFIKTESKDLGEKAKVLQTIKDMLQWFAGSQVRNVASLVGNIITASPISDLNPILVACGAVIKVTSETRGTRNITIDETFFKGYRETVVDDDEVVVTVEIPFSNENQYIKAYKQARRKDDDISIVTAAFSVAFKPATNKVASAKLCYGGMGPTTIHALQSSTVIVGMMWNEKLLNVALESLLNELHLNSSVPGGMAEYRKSLCLSMFFRFYLFVLGQRGINGYSAIHNRLNAAEEIPIYHPESSQCFEIKENKLLQPHDTVGKPIVHLSAFKQTTGEAIYCDDIPQIQGQLYLTLVFSTESHAKIKLVDPSEALKLKGVVAFISAADLDAKCNSRGPIFKDEEIFSKDVVNSRSCIIGAVIADCEFVARKAKHLVKVTYECLEPVLVTIEDAIAHNSYFEEYPRVMKKGVVEDVFSVASNVREGSIRTTAQEHFYLEPFAAVAIYREEELEIVATAQSPAEIAHVVAEALNIPNHKVVCKVKRLGGGFGGKETRAIILAAPVAIAAYKLKRPVRAVLERDEDMQVTGYRHPCLIKYKVAFNDDGKILGAKFEIYVNAGNSMDITCSMLERVLMHVDNCYFIPNIEVLGYICRTNVPSNTAFRGFGAPKSMFAAEHMIRDIAYSLNKSFEEVVNENMYKEGDLTHYNQSLTYCTISRCWKECIESSQYYERKKEVEEFNRSSRWKKRGISLVPTKYGISFQSDFLMQGGALLLVYNDGSVLLTIGGIEMGQGLFTKMVQVASRVLEIDISKIHISEMSSDKVPNSSPTAASISSDLYGMAVIDACNIIKERLRPFKENNPTGSWDDWVLSAYFERVNLSATGFYVAPKIEFNRETNEGRLFEYFTYGVACSEVIIDCLTGDHQVLRTDIVMDLGESLNPAIDIGQVEGAFMQGYGFYTLEEVLFSPTGEVLTKGPGTYKIPGFSDVPKIFNVSLLKGAPNPRAVYSSKAVGEPPLFLAASVYFAIKEAITSARLDAGKSPEFVLSAPATCERIRMACEDHITEKVKPTIKKTGKPWNVMA